MSKMIAYLVAICYKISFAFGTVQPAHLEIISLQAHGPAQEHTLRHIGMRTDEFDYELPKQLIAQVPKKERSGSRLLVLNRCDGTIEHSFFRDIHCYLRQGDVLVLNDTRVIPARLKARKQTGGLVHILLVERIDACTWSCLVEGIKKTADKVDVQIGSALAQVSCRDDFWQIHFVGVTADEVIGRYGTAPLPHYIKRGEEGAEALDAERYQTVYAESLGSIAAPTAGLHFTPELLNVISAMGVTIAKVTLHIGVGTFFLVKKEHIEEHSMHREYFSVKREIAELIRDGRRRGGRVFAVGTSAVRTLETLEQNCNGTAGMHDVAGNGDCNRSNNGHESGSDNGKLQGYTDLFIYPDYCFAAVDALITNFHVPRSTPLLLVSAFAGKENILKAYREALALSYRFYSYGDAMLIL